MNFRLPALLAATALVVTACGSDDPATSESIGASQPATTQKTEAATATTTIATASNSTAAAPSTTDGPPTTDAPDPTTTSVIDEPAVPEPPGGFPVANELEAEFLAANASATVDVLGSAMHYVSAGDRSDTTLVLLHGQPTSSFLWRDVIPGLSVANHVVAPDLIGMGRSERPDIEYTLRDHVEYFDGFVDALGLESIVLVVHDVGGLVGLSWAAQNPDRVAGVAMFETAFAPAASFEQIPDPDFAALLPALRDPEQGDVLINEQNIFVESFLQDGTVSTLGEDVLDVYRAPWADPNDRLPMRMWPTQLAIGGEPADAMALITAAFEWITTTEAPVLLMHADPGLLMPSSIVELAEALIPTLSTTDLGAGVHYLQEDVPDEIATAITDWLAQ